jgi:hypothetical protein
MKTLKHYSGHSISLRAFCQQQNGSMTSMPSPEGNKQHTLHAKILDPTGTTCHYHLLLTPMPSLNSQATCDGELRLIHTQP